MPPVVRDSGEEKKVAYETVLGRVEPFTRTVGRPRGIRVIITPDRLRYECATHRGTNTTSTQ